MPTTFFGWVGYILNQYGSLFVSGTITTLIVALTGTVLGFGIGLLVAIARSTEAADGAGLAKRALVRLSHGLLGFYIEVFRGTPMIVQAVFIYYGIRLAFGLSMSMWVAAFFIVSINTGAYMAETVRGGILSIDSGQTEGAKAIGMNHLQTMLHVILPQAFRNIIPQIGNNFIINIKDTSVLSVISITDLFFVHKSVVGALYLYFQSATIVMAIYLTLTLTSSFLLRKLESRLDGADSYDLATTDTLAHTSGMAKYMPRKRSRG